MCFLYLAFSKRNMAIRQLLGHTHVSYLHTFKLYKKLYKKKSDVNQLGHNHWKFVIFTWSPLEYNFICTREVRCSVLNVRGVWNSIFQCSTSLRFNFLVFNTKSAIFFWSELFNGQLLLINQLILARVSFFSMKTTASTLVSTF